MRFLFGFLCVCALGVMPSVGCSDTTGDGGSGGSAGDGGTGGTAGDGGSGGTAGDGGTGGTPECQMTDDCDDSDACTREVCDEANGTCSYSPVDCDDRNDCTMEACEPADGCTTPTHVADETPCAGGTCQSGACELTGSVLPCTEQGIRNAIGAGGGPYTFDCDGPTTVGTPFVIKIDEDVILDGEGKLTVEQQVPPNNISFVPVFIVADGVTAELRGLSVTGGGFTYSGGGIQNLGNLTLTNSAVFANDGARGNIDNGGTLLVVNSTVSGNQSDQFEIDNCGELTLTNATVFGAGLGSISSGLGCISESVSVTVTNSIVVGGCEGVVTSAGYNIESPGDGCGFDESTDQANVSSEELKLEPLADNGGPKTHALLPGSVAIDHIAAIDCAVDEDQRGEPRPETGGTMCDVGAFEVQP